MRVHKRTFDTEVGLILRNMYKKVFVNAHGKVIIFKFGNS